MHSTYNLPTPQGFTFSSAQACQCSSPHPIFHTSQIEGKGHRVDARCRRSTRTATSGKKSKGWGGGGARELRKELMVVCSQETEGRERSSQLTSAQASASQAQEYEQMRQTAAGCTARRNSNCMHGLCAAYPHAVLRGHLTIYRNRFSTGSPGHKQATCTIQHIRAREP